MIRVESLTIKEFRGIRDLKLNLGSKNFAVCGPNGTGKSGIVDALEFVLTGNITRLRGEGTGEISVKAHAPHVDSRNKPANARVLATISIPALKKTVEVERNAKNPSTVLITPDDPDIRSILQRLAAHPELMLSRRELIRYVLATPGKRAEEVQALLHLDQVNLVRGNLQKVANALGREVPLLANILTQSRESLKRALDVSELTSDNILAAANSRRATLNLPALTSLTDKTSLKDGMTTLSPSNPQRIVKAQALADIKAVREALEEIRSPEILAMRAAVRADAVALSADPALVASLQKGDFLQAGLELIDTESCPFCDNEWKVEELRSHVGKKIRQLEAATAKRKALQKRLIPLGKLSGKAVGTLEAFCRQAALLTPPGIALAVRDFQTACETASRTLVLPIPLPDVISTLDTFVNVPAAVIAEIDALEKSITALPEPSVQDAARDWLTVAQERLEVTFENRRKEKAAKEQAERARKIFDTYSKISDKVLTSIYTIVQTHFASLYSFINKDDEAKFAAKLIPSMGKLGFDVDFYGRGFFPPGAYHSEGHQDSMGLCLYLALMRHLHGDGFTFAVLDDVLMSVDSGHRREVCALLKKEFPNTQFILTTHDQIWLKHMKTEALLDSKSALHFKSWSVEQGPTVWDDRDVWTEIEDYLKGNDVRSAAALLRNYLEYMGGEICDSLRAHVGFRGDARYQLGELLPPAISQLKKLYKSCKSAANSWGQQDIMADIEKRSSLFDTLSWKSQVEQWQVNVAVHYNSWENLKKEDFIPVVNIFKELLGAFQCDKCRQLLRVSPDRDTPESLRCGCSAINLNMIKKKG